MILKKCIAMFTLLVITASPAKAAETTITVKASGGIDYWGYYNVDGFYLHGAPVRLFVKHDTTQGNSSSEINAIPPSIKDMGDAIEVCSLDSELLFKPVIIADPNSSPHITEGHNWVGREYYFRDTRLVPGKYLIVVREHGGSAPNMSTIKEGRVVIEVKNPENVKERFLLEKQCYDFDMTILENYDKCEEYALSLAEYGIAREPIETLLRIYSHAFHPRFFVFHKERMRLRKIGVPYRPYVPPYTSDNISKGDVPLPAKRLQEIFLDCAVEIGGAKNMKEAQNMLDKFEQDIKNYPYRSFLTEADKVPVLGAKSSTKTSIIVITITACAVALALLILILTKRRKQNKLMNLKS